MLGSCCNSTRAGGTRASSRGGAGPLRTGTSQQLGARLGVLALKTDCRIRFLLNSVCVGRGGEGSGGSYCNPTVTRSVSLWGAGGGRRRAPSDLLHNNLRAGRGAQYRQS